MHDDHDHDDVELIGGTEHRKLTLVAADPRWPQRAQDLLAEVAAGLRPRGVRARAAHIGSTAVRGLPAKPIVDLQVAVPDVDDEAAYLPALERAGYRLRVRERRGRHRMLRTPRRDVHLHVWDLGSDGERRHLLFRDHLRVHPDDAAAYAAVKQQLVRRSWPTMQDYADAKSDVVHDILRRADTWAARTGWDPAAAAEVHIGSGATDAAP